MDISLADVPPWQRHGDRIESISAELLCQQFNRAVRMIEKDAAPSRPVESAHQHEEHSFRPSRIDCIRVVNDRPHEARGRAADAWRLATERPASRSAADAPTQKK